MIFFSLPKPNLVFIGLHSSSWHHKRCSNNSMYLQTSYDNSVAGLSGPLSHVIRAVSCKTSKISDTSTSISNRTQSLKYTTIGFDNPDQVKISTFFNNEGTNSTLVSNSQDIISFWNILTLNCSNETKLFF